MLNRIFEELGFNGQRGPITAETVQHGTNFWKGPLNGPYVRAVGARKTSFRRRGAWARQRAS